MLRTWRLIYFLGDMLGRVTAVFLDNTAAGRFFPARRLLRSPTRLIGALECLFDLVVDRHARQRSGIPEETSLPAETGLAIRIPFPGLQKSLTAYLGSEARKRCLRR
jgi:hypothetical protein